MEIIQIIIFIIAAFAGLFLFMIVLQWSSYGKAGVKALFRGFRHPFERWP